MKYVVIIFVVCYAVLSNSCSHDKLKESYYFEAEEINNETDTGQVINILKTRPDTSFSRLFFGKPRFIQLYYTLDSTEFRFKEGKLTEVIIHKPLLDYRPVSITKFGLPFSKPTHSDTSAFFMWKNRYEGFEMINFYLVGSGKDERNVRYKIYLKLKS